MDRIKGRIKSTWGDVTDDDVTKSEGDMERLIGVIKERTGEGVDVIREKIEGFFKDDEEVEHHTHR
jgi:uncharacterized protein YjbJ (UPF0337 family)